MLVGAITSLDFLKSENLLQALIWSSEREFRHKKDLRQELFFFYWFDYCLFLQLHHVSNPFLLASWFDNEMCRILTFFSQKNYEFLHSIFERFISDERELFLNKKGSYYISNKISLFLILFLLS